MRKHNKLVRDKILDICRENGEVPQFRILKNDEYLQALINKLLEEANEIKDDPSIEELADTLEVLHAIGKELGHTPKQIEKARKTKAQNRGGFGKRVFLISTETQE